MPKKTTIKLGPFASFKKYLDSGEAQKARKSSGVRKSVHSKFSEVLASRLSDAKKIAKKTETAAEELDPQTEALIEAFASGASLDTLLEKFNIGAERFVEIARNPELVERIVEAKKGLSLLEFWSTVPDTLATFTNTAAPADAISAMKLWRDIVGVKNSKSGGTVNLAMIFDMAVEALDGRGEIVDAEFTEVPEREELPLLEAAYDGEDSED